MKPRLLEHLVCPQTGDPLDLVIREERHGEIKEGELVNRLAGHRYPISNYVPRFVDVDTYAGSFSKQRLYVQRHFRYYRDNASAAALFHRTTGLCEEDLTKGLTLEVGCGYGRFIDVVERERGEVVGIDLSTHSIELAQSFVGLRENVHLIQCDLFRLPFRKETFKTIYSIGVLHHTPDSGRAFSAMVNYLSPGGRLSIWVYPPEDQANVKVWRRFTSRWPTSWLYAFCILNQVAFSWIRIIPVVRWRFNRLIPGSVPARGRPFWNRVLEDFDNLSPQYASTHTPEDVMQWFREAGLRRVRSLDRRTSVTGVKLPA